MEDIVNWISNWYKAQCNGDWEHQCGIKIDTIDNPGWRIKVDLADTVLENLEIEYKLIEKSENDWYGFSIREGEFEGVGDPLKLQLLLYKFKELVEAYTST